MNGSSFRQRVERLLQNQAAGLHDAAQLQHRARHRIDVIIQHPVHGILDAVDHVVQVRGKRLNVFRIERRDKGGVQPRVDVS